jgi:hypothetical protein
MVDLAPLAFARQEGWRPELEMALARRWGQAAVSSELFVNCSLKLCSHTVDGPVI